MKIASVILIGFLLLFCAGNTFAILTVPSLEMVDADTSTTAQPHGGPSGYALYGWDEQPWLWVSLPSETFHYTVSWWNAMSGGDPVYYNDYEASSGVSDVWHSPDNWFATARQSGDWQIKLDYSIGGAPADSTYTNFTVNAVPEPISSALFLVGGITLAAIQYRKRRKA